MLFRHNDIRDLEAKLRDAGDRHTLLLFVVDAAFSMEGDIANLLGIVDFCRQHGVLLMVDESHSLGALGQTARGVEEHFDLGADCVDIKMGTLSNALASYGGGFVASNTDITRFLSHRAAGYVFSGALPAGQIAASIAALRVLEDEPQCKVALIGGTTRFG